MCVVETNADSIIGVKEFLNCWNQVGHSELPDANGMRVLDWFLAI